MPVSGLKLNFNDDGEVEVKKGKRQLPHRVELVEQAFAEERYEDAWQMIFNFSLRNCRHATNKALLERENKIFERLNEY
jgi:hypothetical protein